MSHYFQGCGHSMPTEDYGAVTSGKCPACLRVGLPVEPAADKSDPERDVWKVSYWKERAEKAEAELAALKLNTPDKYCATHKYSLLAHGKPCPQCERAALSATPAPEVATRSLIGPAAEERCWERMCKSYHDKIAEALGLPLTPIAGFEPMIDEIKRLKSVDTRGKHQ